MFSPLSLKDFYGQTLKQAGFTPPEDSIEKFAAANKLDLETTKIASAVFEQLQLDGVKYDSPQDMFQDALKIAHAYMDHVKEATIQADKLAGDLHRVARHAVEGYLATHGIELDADEGVKIAGLQARSFQALTQKQAELRQLEDSLASLKCASEIKKAFNAYGQVPGGTMADPSLHDLDATTANVADHFGAGGDPNAHEGLKKFIGSQVPEAQRPDYFNALHQNAQKMPGSTFADVHKATMAGGVGGAGAAQPKGLLQRPGLMLGAGALGLGGLYLLKKKREEAAAANNRRQSIQGAAMMPSA